jgi:Na+-translocating ferredoxin:NAD+ oxidoreductase RnfA subunit
MNVTSILLTALIGGNILLTKFIDITYLRNLRKLDVAFFVGLFMIDIALISGVLYFLVYHFFLVPFGFTFFGFITAVLIIALVSEGELWALKRFFPSWHERYGFYFPLISINALLTYLLLQFQGPTLTLVDVLVSSLAVPAGFVMINLLMVIYQERLEKLNRVPAVFQGLSITFIILALIAMALVGLGG